MQRIFCGSHFLSDLFGSAAIGLWWSYVCYHPSLMGSLFEKLETEDGAQRVSALEESALQEGAVRRSAAVQMPAQASQIGYPPDSDHSTEQDSQGSSDGVRPNIPPQRAA